MPIDKKQVAMWTAGTLASVAATFLVYRLEKKSQAANAANQQAASDAAAQAEAQQQNQEQSYLATQPAVSVPSITATTTSDVNTAADNGGATPSSASALEALVTSFLSQENSSVTSQTSPHGIDPLPSPAASSVSTSPVDLSQPIGGVTLASALANQNNAPAVGATQTVSTPLKPISIFSTGQ